MLCLLYSECRHKGKTLESLKAADGWRRMAECSAADDGRRAYSLLHTAVASEPATLPPRRLFVAFIALPSQLPLRFPRFSFVPSPPPSQPSLPA